MLSYITKVTFICINVIFVSAFAQQPTASFNFIPGKVLVVNNSIINNNSATVTPVETCIQYSSLIYTCSSFQAALEILENNTVINITNDVVLLESIVQLKELNNVAIVGQSDTTVECNGSGVLNISSCNNVTIRGITWNTCGTYMKIANDNFDLLSINQYPGITFNQCSNILIHHCIFQKSLSSAVYLFEVSGIISIDHVQFLFNGPSSLIRGVVNNLQYVAMGLTITQLASFHAIAQLNISIIRCKFSYNHLILDRQGHSSVLLINFNSISSNINILITETSFTSNNNILVPVQPYGLAASANIVNIRIINYFDTITITLSKNTFESNNLETSEISSILELFIMPKRFTEIHIQMKHCNFFNNTAFKVADFYQHNFDTFSTNAGFHDQGSGYDVMHYSSNASLNKTDNHITNVIDGCTFSLNIAGKSILYISNNYDSDNYSDQFTIVNSTFEHNSETVIYVINHHVTFQKTVKFVNNIADYGAAIYLDYGASIKFDEGSNLTFKESIARRYGGAIFYDISQFSSTCDNEHISILVKDNSTVNFNNNAAGIAGNSIYVNIPQSCNISSLLDMVNDFNYSEPTRDLITSPNELVLYYPAVLMSNIDSVTVYKLSGIMLGQTINIPACVLDYQSHYAGTVLFQITRIDFNQKYSVIAPNVMSISCGSLRTSDIHITGQRLEVDDNSSVTIQFSSTYNSVANWKSIRVNLIIELSPCHPGYFYDDKLKQCVCYKAKDVVSCLNDNATIMKGYWFGMVNNKPTIAECPINYCDFKYCETATGVCTLPSSLDEQCMPHRTGPACGNCVEGYTLSFDSTECVNTDKCSIGITILMIIITLIYWAVITAAIFGVMHFQVNIAYFYVITYFYSMLNILFEQTLHPSNHAFLYTLVAIMSGVVKLTPRFMGQLCFIEGMSGIDQQFIHYMHPLVIWLVIAIICILARFSRSLSAFLSRGIIHAICLLLLLSFTSGASSTSLMLMVGINFYDIDALYVNVSPDTMYFQGRHLFYSIVAYIFVILIVLGLPLILLSEPFLNRKINFSRFKPLLDQFQGCYKDRLRFFASYYMICRQVILNIVVNSYENFIPLNSLFVTCTIINLIHWLVRPYASEVLNIYDGLVLQIMTAIIALQIIYFDNFDSVVPITLAFILVILPIILLIAMTLVLNAAHIKKLHMSCLVALRIVKRKDLEMYQSHTDSEREEYGTIVDQELRERSTTILYVTI